MRKEPMPTPRLNWFLLIVFCLISIGVLIASFVFPSFRSRAYAPLREIVLPPPQPLVLSLLYSTEKDAWLEEVLEGMQDDPLIVNGRPLELVTEKMGSREMYLWSVLGKSRESTNMPLSTENSLVDRCLERTCGGLMGG